MRGSVEFVGAAGHLAILSSKTEAISPGRNLHPARSFLDFCVKRWIRIPSPHPFGPAFPLLFGNIRHHSPPSA